MKAFAEVRHNGRWFAAKIDRVQILPAGESERHPAQVWDTQNYTMFGWLADIRNYSGVPPITSRRGMPEDVSDEVGSIEAEEAYKPVYGHSWLSLAELLAFDYDAMFEDLRPNSEILPKGKGGDDAIPGHF